MKVWLAIVMMLTAVSVGAAEPRRDESLAVIESYIAKQRGWQREDYRIEQKAPEGDQKIYWIIFLPDTLRSDNPPGGGKSFIAVYDTKTKRVTERRFVYPSSN